MSKLRLQALFACLAFGLSAFSVDLAAQGKGGGKDKEGRGGNPHEGHKGKSGENNKGPKGQKSDNPGRGNSGAARSDNKVSKAERSVAKDIAKANRGNGRVRASSIMSSAAIAKASARGRGNNFRVEDVGDRVRIVNRNGAPLLFISDDEAREMGRWRVGLQDNVVREGAPSFCRSGAGHPVWGRQWCVNKGFGIGNYEDYRWGRTTDLSGWSYPRTTYQPSLTGAVLQTILGPTAYNRLALHAIELGFLEPLTGRYVTEPNEPQVLLVNSGAYPVAELRDTNRDFSWDDLLVALLAGR